GCESAILKVQGVDTEYKISDYSPTRLVLKNENAEGYALELFAPSTLEVTYFYTIYDYNCDPRDKPVHVKLKDRWHFAVNGQRLPGQETLSADLLGKLCALPVLNETLSAVCVQAPVTSEELSLSAAELARLTELPVPPEMLVCDGN